MTSMISNMSNHKVQSSMFKVYSIASGVKAFSTTRKGGVSQGNYSEFNIAATMPSMWLKTAGVWLPNWA